MPDDRRKVVASLLGMLKDVLINGLPSNGQALVFDLTNKVWKPGTPSPIENVNTVSASGSTETLPDVDVATMHRVTLTANCTLTFPAAAAGKSFSLELVQDGTGSRTVTWPGSVLWPGGTAPTLSTAAGSVDDFAFVCFDGSNFSGFFAGSGMA